MELKHDKIVISEAELLNADGGFTHSGLEIEVPGFRGNPQCPDEGQIWIEVFEDQLQVHVWSGEDDPVVKIPREGI